mgnify:FL=1
MGMVFVESVLTVVAEKSISEIWKQVQGHLSQSDVKKAIKSGLSKAEEQDTKLPPQHKLFYRCEPKEAGDFLGQFFQDERVQKELTKPIHNEGNPELAMLVAIFSKLGEDRRIELNANQIKPWLDAFVKAYGDRSGAYLGFQVAKKHYFQQLKQYFGDVKFAGIDVPGEEVEKSERLAQIFVMPEVQQEKQTHLEREWLQAQNKEAFEAQPEQFRREEGRKFSAEQLLSQGMYGITRRAVILGAPGSGKTTLLSYFAVMTALGHWQPLGLSEEVDWLPILVPIRNWAWKLDLGLLDYVREFAEKSLAVQDLPQGFFEHWLEDHRALILLDGLDEVADEAKRCQVVERIGSFLGRFAQNWAMITSRPAGYRRDFFRMEEFPHYQLLPFDWKRIEQFVSQWYESRSDNKEEAKRWQTSLQKALEENDRIKLLASNPLLLTIIALIHRYSAYLPRERYKLYDKAVDTLITSWDKRKEVTSHKKLHYLELDDLRRVLERLAEWVHCQGVAENKEGGTLVAREDLQDWLSQEIKAFKGVQFYQAKAEAERFLDFICDRTGLLNEQGQDFYGFVHKTFQEYLCAEEIDYQQDNEGDFDIVLKAIREHLHESHWREVLLLLIAQQKPKKAAKAIRAVLHNQSDYEQWLHRDLFFAADCLAEDPKNLMTADSSLPQEIIKRLVELEVSDRDRVGEKVKEQVYESLQRLSETAFEEQALQLIKDCAEEISEDRLFRYRKELGDRNPMVQEQLERLSDKDSEVRSRAASALRDLGVASDSVIQALLDRLTDEDSMVRSRAAMALEELGVVSDSVIQALRDRLTDEDAEVRSGAALALGELGVVSDSVIQALLDRLTDEDAEVRSGAASALRKLGVASDSVIQALLDRLTDEDSLVRSRAASALGELGVASDSVIQALRDRLTDEDSLVRYKAVSVLRKLGIASDLVLQALLDLLRDQSDLVGLAELVAASILRELEVASDSAFIQALLDQLTDEVSLVRYKAAMALEELGVASDSVIQALLDRLTDEDSMVRSVAASALGELGVASDSVIQALLDRLGVASDSVIQALLDQLTDEDYMVRSGAASALGELGVASDSVIQALLDRLTDEDYMVCSGAAIALGNLAHKSPSIIPQLVAWIEQHQGSDYLGNGIDALWVAVVDKSD